MSRYYRIVVGQEVAIAPGQVAPSGNLGATWTNWVNGRADLGAQTIEFDIPLSAMDQPIGNASIKIWGVSKEQISQSSDFNGAPIQVYAGMHPGLPLASAAYNDGQSGLLLSGQVFQAFGNWQGINQTLDFVVQCDGGATQSSPGNISFLWKQGQPLSAMVQSVLQQAYPKFKFDIKLRSNLVLTQDEPGTYSTLQQFASYVKAVSQQIITKNYPGVSIYPPVDGTIKVWDDTATKDAGVTEIKMQDLIGSPTWMNVATIQFNTMLRADLQLGAVVKFLPAVAAIAISNAQSGSNVRLKNAFDGTWTVTLGRHIGNSRAADGNSWISTFQAVSNTAIPPDSSASIGNSSA